MDNLTRYELSTILDGLQFVRNERRAELLEDGQENLFGCDEYRNIVTLQEKFLSLLDKMTY
jgi:hypothetical protein